MRVYRASSLGYSLEQLVAPHLGYEPVDPPEFLQKAYDEGNRLEPIVITELKSRNWFITDEQLEVEFDVIPERAKVVGHLDGTGHPDNWPLGVIEIKSMADKAWRDFALNGWASSSPLIDKYKWQASAYMLATGKPHYLVAWNKETEVIAVEFVTEPFYSIADIAAKLAQAEECIRDGVLPEGCTDYPCPYFYLHADKDAVPVEQANDELESLMAKWLDADKAEKEAKRVKDKYRKLIMAGVEAEPALGKIRGECGVTVSTNWVEAKHVEYDVKEHWETRIQGTRK